MDVAAAPAAAAVTQGEEIDKDVDEQEKSTV